MALQVLFYYKILSNQEIIEYKFMSTENNNSYVNLVGKTITT